jgi:putative spermidine/putrescine transport system permease protein
MKEVGGVNCPAYLFLIRKTKMGNWFKRQRRFLITLLMLAPGFLGFFGLFLYPMLVTVIRSLRPERQDIGWTLENYADVLGKARFREAVVLTFVLAVSSTLLSVVLSVPLALALREKVRGHRLFRLTILIPITVPGLIGALGLLLLWASNGWINLFLVKVVPFIKEPARVNYTVPGLIIFYLWHYFPYTAVTTLATLEGLDRSIEEAASVVGANSWQVIRYVVLPLIMPGILAGSVLTFMAAFGAFSIPLITGGNYRPLSVFLYTQINFSPPRWSAASAIAVIMAFLQVIFLSLYMRSLRRPEVSR